MIAGLVVEALEVFVEAAVVACAGAGDQENQRCGVVLGGHAVGEFFHRPEVVRQFEGALGAQRQAVIALIDIFVQWQLWPQFWRCRGNRRFKRVGKRVAITGGIDIHRQCGRTQDKAAEYGSEAQGTEHD
ncbi:hypothetical protein D3C71_1766290 [compost metagenome]